jgi:hypothetical protein
MASRKKPCEDADDLVVVRPPMQRNLRFKDSRLVRRMHSRLSFSSLLFLSSINGSNAHLHMRSIGIDMSKATFHAALDDVFVRKVKNTKEGIDVFIASIGSLGHIPNETTIGVESTCAYRVIATTGSD